MTMLESITTKLGFNPLYHKIDANSIPAEEDDTRISPFSVLNLEEKLYLSDLYHLLKKKVD